MRKVLLLANLELSFEIPDGTGDTDELVQRKERKLMRLLERLAREDQPAVEGSLERLELESFTYEDAYESDASSYYYNKYERTQGAN
ncbi:MAG: hypothetical protein AB7N76_10135 [Planctomycetota bacterium]